MTEPEPVSALPADAAPLLLPVVSPPEPGLLPSVDSPDDTLPEPLDVPEPERLDSPELLLVSLPEALLDELELSEDKTPPVVLAVLPEASFPLFAPLDEELLDPESLVVLSPSDELPRLDPSGEALEEFELLLTSLPAFGALSLDVSLPDDGPLVLLLGPSEEALLGPELLVSMPDEEPLVILVPELELPPPIDVSEEIIPLPELPEASGGVAEGTGSGTLGGAGGAGGMVGGIGGTGFETALMLAVVVAFEIV